MKKYFAVCLILIFFTGFVIFTYSKQSFSPVLKILNPVKIQVDVNNNGIIEDDETICLPDAEAFSLAHGQYVPEFAKTYALTLKDTISLGYMADNFASSLILAQPVKVKFTGRKNPDCRYADIYLNDKSYLDILVDEGYAAKRGKLNRKKFDEKLKIARNLDLVIYNIKSGKYHKLDCKYGLLSSNHSIIPKKQLPKDALPCKFCFVTKKSEQTNKKHSKNNILQAVQTPELVHSDGKLELILTDFTTKLKPDRNCDTKVCLALVEEINKAENTIDFAVYGMDLVPKIYDALKQAKTRNVKIRMVFDKSSSPEMDYYTETEKMLELADEYASDYVKGKSAYTNNLMHNKFFIFDGITVLTGSMNISATGLSDYNANAVVILNSQDIAKLYTAEFEQMLSGKFHELKTKPDLPDTFTLEDSEIQVLFSPYDKISEKIIPLINSAEEYIYVPAFLITHNGITNALIDAKKRNVDVKIIIDANSVSTRNTKYVLLRQNKIPLKTENYAGKLHSKTILIDDKYIITGSMNFSNSGENKNDENLLIINCPRLTKLYKTYFLYLWSKIPDEYLTKNAAAESKDSIGACYDGIDNDFDGLVDRNDPGCR